MPRSISTRRSFLESLALGGAALPAGLLSVRRGLLEHLETIQGKDLARLDREYTLDPRITYLNHASIGTIPRAVQKAHAGYLAQCERNPWLHMWGGAWEAAREHTRVKAAELLGCQPEELALSHNTTEGFNMLSQGLPLDKGDEVLFSTLNHAGASHCWHHHAKALGYSVRQFPFPIGDVPELTAEDVVSIYRRQITEHTRVLVFPHIDNVVGLRYPVKEMAAMARANGVEFVAVDGAQAVGMIPLHLAELDIDAYCASPHKWVQSPKGTGLLYLRRGLQAHVRPMWVTWGQERWRGSVRIFEDYGTRNLPEVLALGDAVEFQQALGAPAKEARRKQLWQRCRAAVSSQPRLRWRSPKRQDLATSLLAIEVAGRDSQALFDVLWKQHGCVFRPMHQEGFSTLRISPNLCTTEAQIDRFFELLRRETA